jgi:hypothetical protein
MARPRWSCWLACRSGPLAQARDLGQFVEVADEDRPAAMPPKPAPW